MKSFSHPLLCLNASSHVAGVMGHHVDASEDSAQVAKTYKRNKTDKLDKPDSAWSMSPEDTTFHLPIVLIT